MKYIINQNEKTPAYLQLYQQVRNDITTGIYPKDTKLPSKRVTAESTGLSTITVEHAYALLCDEGYIEPRQRSGYFVIFAHSDGFLTPTTPQAELSLTHVHHQTDLPEFPFSVLAKTMRTVISDLGEDILEKSPNEGVFQLREAIRLYLLRSRGISADLDQIVIGSGSEYLYSLIVELLGRQKTYAIESPSYKKIEEVYLASDVKLEKLPLGEDGIRTEALKKSAADVLHISPYRSYPSGVTATATKRYEYISWAKSGGKFIVEDDFESEFSVSKKLEETVFSLSKSDNVIYMNTFSKTISPSLRTGYMVLPKCLVGAFREKLGFYSCTVPTCVQYVLAKIISNGDFERHINRVRRAKRKL